jgi:PAS domain S-box-containing protein
LSESGTRVPDAREVLDALYTFVGVLTTDGVLIEANRAPLAAAGITIDDVRGRPFWDCYWWNYDSAVRERCRAACASAARGESVRFDVNVRMAGERTMPIDFQIAPLRDAAGRITHLIPSAVEITARHTTEASLREANALLDAIFATAPVGLAFWDREFRFRRVNERLAEINGFPTAAHVGKRPDELLPDIAGVGELLDSWRELLRTGRPLMGVEIVGSTPAAPGVERSWREDFFPVRIGDTIVGIGAVVLETTEQKRQQAALIEADRRKDEFLAMLAHELRNPLGAISNATAVLARFRGTDPQLGTIGEMLERQVRHLGRLVDDLLDVARIAQDKLVLRRSRTDLADAVRQAVEANSGTADGRGQRIDVRLPARPLPLDADPARLAQIVANLVHNAVKYTHEGGQIAVAVRVVDGSAVLEVKDDGPGIAPDLIGRVFDLFAQGDRGVDRSDGGLGIGLTLVRRLVEMHGGRVEAESEGLGRGATFRVTLPLAAGSAGEADDRESSSADASASTSPLRVLVVDDNADVLTSMTMLLELEGHAVTTAHDAQATFAAVEDFHPDAVLLDLGLPGLDGYEVAKRLRERLGPAVLLVAVTGYGQPEDRARSRSAGFDHHLLKPVDFDALQALLATAPRNVAPDCVV